MQPVTVAISPTGIQYLIENLLGDQIAQALKSHLTAPNYNFQPSNFNFLPGGSAIENDYSNISINITNGQIQSISPAFSGCAQGPDGDNSKFAITMTVNGLNVGYPNGWEEIYDYQAWTWNRGGMKVKAYSDQNGHHDNRYDYSVAISGLAVQATFQLVASSGAYELTYVPSSASAHAGSPQPSIPGGSILNQQESGACGYSSHIASATVQSIGNMSWSSALSSALNPVFASIGESGQLGPVTFDFLDPSDTQPVFPSGGGIQLGAKGLVSVNGSAYPAPPPADLQFPPIPTGNPAPHVRYFVQDYEVNALFWGFFKAGALHTTLNPGDLGDEASALETNTYENTNLRNLWLKYPGTVMSADLSARCEPTTAFQTIYQLNPDNISKIQAILPASLWADDSMALTALSSGAGTTFSSQTGFETELGNIDTALLTYAPEIEQHAGMPGVVVTHTTRCILNVLHKNDWIPVITFDVAQTFVMQGLQLGVAAGSWSPARRYNPPVHTQSVLFTFTQPSDAQPNATFVSSTIPGVDGANFGDVWEALSSSWMKVFEQIGKAGLPLPRIPGFDFLFQQAQVGVNAATSTADGYLSITANVSYAPEKLTPAVRQFVGGRATVRRV